MSLLHQPNTNYELAVFDFDGTIADTSPGILDAHRFTLASMGKTVPNDNELRQIIGGNLLKTYQNTFGFQEVDAVIAVKIYRERYAKQGIHMAALYPSFEAMLKGLKAKGVKIGVATLKAESFAKIMLEELGVREYFNAVCGMNQDDSLSKADLIVKCAKMCATPLQHTVLVGDSKNDYLGAKEAGVAFIGVTYGFGFKSTESYDFSSISSPIEFLNII